MIELVFIRTTTLKSNHLSIESSPDNFLTDDGVRTVIKAVNKKAKRGGADAIATTRIEPKISIPNNLVKIYYSEYNTLAEALELLPGAVADLKKWRKNRVKILTKLIADNERSRKA